MDPQTDTPSVDAQDEDHPFRQLAKKYWLKAKTPSKVQAKVLKNEIWDSLAKEDFQYRLLLLLESLQVFEKYLWPTFDDSASDYHILLIALIVNVKHREGLASWSLFEARPAEFSLLFRRIISTLLDTTLKPRVRWHTLVAIIGAFQSLDNPLVRQECAPLVSIGTWHNLHSAEARDHLLEAYPQFKRAWKGAVKRYDNADEEHKSKVRFDRSWLYTLLLDFLDIIHNSSRQSPDDILYCERFLEFLCDLQSQFPTRRYVNTLLQDLNLPLIIKLSPLYADGRGSLIREQYVLLRHYTLFPIDDQTGEPHSDEQVAKEHSASLMTLQRTALKHFKDKLTMLALANHGSLSSKDELKNMLQPLSDEELVQFVSLLNRRTEYPSISSIKIDRNFLLAVIQSMDDKKSSFKDSIKDMSVLPTEDVLYEDSFVRNEHFNGTQSLALPKLNLQYLTVSDFFWRSFILYRCEAFFEIKRDIEDTVKRMQPEASRTTGQVLFKGVSRMALASTKPAVVEVVQPKVGDKIPAEVRAEIILDVSRVNDGVRKEWESLRPDDVVFLLSVQAPENSRRITNGSSKPDEQSRLFRNLRCAEIIQVLDEKGRPVRHAGTQENGYHGRPRQRRLLVKLDAIAYQQDAANGEKDRAAVYDGLNLCVRRRSRENNFIRMLETIRHLTLSDAPLPNWLRDVFLGLGDPNSVSYKSMTNRLESIDFRDTFLDWAHLKDSLAGIVKAAGVKEADSIDPPYVLSSGLAAGGSSEQIAPKRRKREGEATEAADPKSVSTSKSAKQSSAKASTKGSRKRPRDEVDENEAGDVIEVSTYKLPNTGPYPTDVPKTNSIRFTTAQVEAIRSGTQPGLTMIVGPPGTGKTDVATQIINNIYHNFPTERTLLIAHSNQALNQLFQKIVALDIDQRHLLRLGHGEEDLQLENDASYSKSGRVESFLENRDLYLREVDRLATSMGAPGAHGSSCETAEYFNSVYVKPTWTKYLAQVETADTTAQDIATTFPFLPFFANAPQPIFPIDTSKESALEIAQGCYRHITRVFTELEEIRPFEILRNARDKSNYLLISEARVIAMTTTHAAIRRQEIADLGFHYDNVVIEEAAQVTEIENVIPLALQHPNSEGDMPVKRVILLGDHLQNSPIVQNQAFRQFASLDQSLFLRLVRLGVPTYLLDAQGRARPSIAALYKFRYPRLTDLPHVLQSPEFTLANAGFRYEYQFVDVPDYKDKGEAEPTPHFLQNLGEAEFAVALFMYMRLLGYPARSITILTSYSGQRALIRDVLAHRCKGNRLFGLPRTVTTMDKYQGEQNDYIILSLVRTTRPGFLRDLRRLTVGLSRARLGLYVLGRRAVFEAVPELAPAFSHLFSRPTDALHVVTTELFGSVTRKVADDNEDNNNVESTPIESVEHLGKYVFEMTGAKVAQLKRDAASAAGNAGTADLGTSTVLGAAGLAEVAVQRDLDEDDEDAGIDEFAEPLGADEEDEEE